MASKKKDKRNRLSPKRRRVKGINSTIDDVRLLGEEWRTNVKYNVLDASLSRTIEGASTLTMDIHDPECDLLGSELLEAKFDVEIDDLWFRFAALDRQDTTTSLTFEDREVAMLRTFDSPRKVLRSKMTRAEFILSMIRECKHPRIPAYILELHKEQPIAQGDNGELDVKGTGGKQASSSGGGGGFDSTAGLTVKGVKPNAEQIKNVSIVLGVGMELNAPKGALVAAICAGTQENNLMNSTNDGFFALLDSTEALFNVSISDLAEVAKIAYTRGFWHAGLIDSINKGLSPGDAAQEMEGSAYPDLYAQWEGEAKKWVEAYTGGKYTGGSGGTKTITKPYSFERKKGEDTWTCSGRLADEVQWRRFMSSGVFYYASEEDLFTGPLLLDIDEVNQRGINSVDFNWDGNKLDTEVTIEAYVKNWAAPPGSVIRLGSIWGPAQGRYIVSTIDKGLFSETATITLKRPMKELPEPAPETTTKSTGGGSSSSAGGSGDGVGINGVDLSKGGWDGTEAVMKQVVFPLASRYGVTIGGQKETGHAVGGDHDPAVSNAYACDFGTTSGAPFAKAAAQALGISGYHYGDFTGWPFTVNGKVSMRAQILWQVPDHYDHVHVGLRTT